MAFNWGALDLGLPTTAAQSAQLKYKAPSNISSMPTYNSSVLGATAISASAPKPAPGPTTPDNNGGGGGGGESRQQYLQRTWLDAGNQGTPSAGWGGPGDGGGGAAGQPSWDSQLEDIYSGQIGQLDRMAGDANTAYTGDVNSLESQYGLQQGQYQTQKDQLLAGTDTSQTRYNDTLRSAYEDAVRSYNALAQQASARFGRGSSAGGAVGELAQQEFFRQQGQLQQKQAQGSQDFETERGKINMYITDQVNQLKDYKNQAMDQLKQSLKEQLTAIEGKKVEMGSNKARDKMALLQQAVSTAQTISDGETKMQKDIALQALGQMQQLSGRTFTPQEIVAYLQDFQNQFLSAGGLGTSAPQSSLSTKTFKRTVNPEDQFQGIVSPSYGTGQ